MNKRAKQRLIGVSTMIILIVGVAFMTLNGSGTEEVKVADVLKGETGERVKVSGIIVDDSWDGKANPMRFVIRDEDDVNVKGPKLPVVYGGVVPSGFGNKTKTILTGTLEADGTFKATNMLTQCPSKYKAKGAPLSVAELLAKKKEIGDVTTKVEGWLTETPSSDTFTIQSRRDGGDTLDVIFAGKMGEAAQKGAKVELTGQLSPEGVLKASAAVITLKAK